MRQYAPRFLLVVVVVPLCFVLAAFAAAQLGREPAPVAALVGAVVFAALALAPSTRNALVRAALLLALTAIAWSVTALVGTERDQPASSSARTRPEISMQV